MILNAYQVMVKTFAKQRPTLNNIWNEVFPANGPESKSLIEISGATGTGKSILLYELMARASLSTLYGGKGSKVIFLDLTHKFDLNVYIKYVQKLMNQNLVCSQKYLQNTLRYCDCIIFLPCYSADQLQFAFEELENLLWEHKNLSLIAIDGLDTFYWDECYGKLLRMSTHYKGLIKRLKPICEDNNICCAYTVDTNYISMKSKTFTYFPHSLIDYKIKLFVRNDGRRYLNQLPIEINNNGIEFLNSK